MKSIQDIIDNQGSEAYRTERDRLKKALLKLVKAYRSSSTPAETLDQLADINDAGTKKEANANKYSFVWRNAVEKYQRKLNGKAEKDLTVICEKHGIDPGIGLERAGGCLRSLAELQGIEFVYGKGKHKTQLQRDAEKLVAYIEKGREYDYPDSVS